VKRVEEEEKKNSILRGVCAVCEEKQNGCGREVFSFRKRIQ
jgi:hypothetical protein